jgi:hypothetical protein
MPAPFKLFRSATADLPPAADYTGALAWDSTLTLPTWSNGTAWVQPSLSTHVHAAADVTFTPAGNIAATDVQAAVEELDAEKAASVHSHSISDVTGLQTALDAKLDEADYTAADVLTKLLTVDGAGSGLDADLLDGNSSAAFALASHDHDSDYQPLDSDLTTLAANITAAGHALVDDADASAQRTTLGLGAVATQTYTEDTFTPTLTFGGAATGMTFAANGQLGRYTRIGRVVFYTIRFVLTNKGSSTGSAVIGALPLTSAALPGDVPTIVASNMATVAVPAGTVATSGTTISLFDYTSSALATLTHADFNNNSILLISGFYSV